MLVIQQPFPRAPKTCLLSLLGLLLGQKLPWQNKSVLHLIGDPVK